MMAQKNAHDDQSIDHEQTTPVSSEMEQQLAQLQAEVQQAKEAELRSRADYQNLQRRTQDERIRLVKMATKDLMSSLLQPLDHLSLAAQQVNDPGLQMTIKQFWTTLENFGLEEINPVGAEFDVQIMEAVERLGEGNEVLKVVKRGYKLNGEVIQYAKVIVGDPNAQKEDQHSDTKTATKKS